MMMRYSYLFLVFFSLFGVSSCLLRVATTEEAFVPKYPVLTKRQLSVRGGGAGIIITQDAAAKSLTAVYVLQGSAFMLAPETTFKPYGIRELNDAQQGSGEYFGTMITAIGVAGYCLFVQDTSINTALGSGFSVLVLDGWRSLLADRLSKCGYKGKAAHLPTIGNVISAYALLTNQKWATKFVTYWCYFGLLNGVLGILNPSKWTMTWGQHDRVAKDTLVRLFNRSSAFSMCAFASLCLTLFNNVDRYKAFGFASAIFGAHFISANFVMKDLDKLGMNKAAFNFWIALFTIWILSLLL